MLPLLHIVEELFVLGIEQCSMPSTKFNEHLFDLCKNGVDQKYNGLPRTRKLKSSQTTSGFHAATAAAAAIS